MKTITQPAKLRFESELPKVQTIDQAKAVLKCRFQKELDEYFERNATAIEKQISKD